MAIRTYIKNGKKLHEAYINGFDARGVRIQRKRKGIDTLRKAEQVEFELKRELALLKEKKIEPYFEEWLEEALGMMKVLYRPSTFYTYEKTIGRWIEGKWSGRPISAITKADVHELIFEKIPEDQASMQTRKCVLKMVKRIFQMAVDHGKLAINPCNGMMVKVPESDKKVLTNSEVETFLHEARATNHRFYPVWIVALFTGMRSGELYALRWSDVDLENRTISVSRGWNSKNGYTSTKNQKSRVVPISDELLGFLKGYKLERGGEEYVLPHLTEWTRGDAAKVIKAFCKSLRISQVQDAKAGVSLFRKDILNWHILNAPERLDADGIAALAAQFFDQERFLKQALKRVRDAKGRGETLSLQALMSDEQGVKPKKPRKPRAPKEASAEAICDDPATTPPSDFS